MQLNKTGIALFLFFGLGGLAFVIAGVVIPMPAEGRFTFILLGGIWVLVIVGLILFARREDKKADHQDWVFENGIRGTATVLDAGSSTTVNEMPLMKLKLELDIPGVGRSEVSRREVMPVFTAQRMNPGLVLPAYANPQDPNDFVLVW
ncbi:MAG TPA: hypothetical protein VFJ57_06570 [Solirubrobacterales bacterium]|nr:hypothetical protein [Solirubrobacterales bacterium]